MILRDAIFTGERRHLGAQPAPSPSDPQVREMPAEYTVQDDGASRALELRAPEPPPLSSDRVASWLVTQDGKRHPANHGRRNHPGRVNAAAIRCSRPAPRASSQ